jgi:hypothetical protein
MLAHGLTLIVTGVGNRNELLRRRSITDLEDVIRRFETSRLVVAFSFASVSALAYLIPASVLAAYQSAGIMDEDQLHKRCSNLLGIFLSDTSLLPVPRLDALIIFIVSVELCLRHRPYRAC